MSESKHTPGPWEVARGCELTGYPFYAICGMSGDEKRDYETLEANRHLIAAAPDLLEALEWAMKTIDDLVKQICNHEKRFGRIPIGGMGAADIGPWIDPSKARAAIAKARGQA